MRWVFISLLLINLVYLGFQFSKGEDVAEQKTVDVKMSANDKSLQLLAEVDTPLKKKLKSKTVNKNKLCWMAGPFDSQFDAKQLHARATALDVPSTVDFTEKVIKTESWVHLPPLANYKQAVRKLKELQKRGIDSHIISKGELSNGISLGLFGQQESVDRLLKKLKKKGLEPEVKVIERTQKVYWVVAELGDGFILDQKTQQRLVHDLTVTWQKNQCNSALPTQL